MIIELYGIPGSGKTTLAKELVRRNKDRFVYLHSSPRSEIIRLVPLFCIYHPRIASFWFSELFKETLGKNFFKIFRYKLHLLLITLAQYQKSAQNKNTVFILDEGLLQRIFTLYDAPQSERKIRACIKHLHPFDLLMRTSYSKDAFRRVLVPPYTIDNPRVELGPEYIKKWMEAVAENDKTICRILKEKKTSVVWLKGDQEVNSLAELVEREIFRFNSR